MKTIYKLFLISALVTPVSVFAAEFESLSPQRSNVLATSRGLPKYGPLLLPMYPRKDSQTYVVETKLFKMSNDMEKDAGTSEIQAPLYLAIAGKAGEYDVFDTGLSFTPDVSQAVGEYGTRCRYIRRSYRPNDYAILIADIVTTSDFRGLQYYLLASTSGSVGSSKKLSGLCQNSDSVVSIVPEAKPFFTQPFGPTPSNVRHQ